MFLQASAVATQHCCKDADSNQNKQRPLLVLEPVYSLESRGSAAHYGVNMPSSFLPIRRVRQGLVFREELGGCWG